MTGSNPIRSYYPSNLPRRRATANFKDGQERLRRTGSSDWSFGWTIAVVGEILAQPQDGFAGYESTWYWIVNQLFGEL